MKKATTILLVGLLLMAFAGTVMAETQTPTPQVPVPNQDFFQQMWNLCHGPNGMMNGYLGGNNNAAPQGFFGRMMGW